MKNALTDYLVGVYDVLLAVMVLYLSAFKTFTGYLLVSLFCG